MRARICPRLHGLWVVLVGPSCVALSNLSCCFLILIGIREVLLIRVLLHTLLGL